MFQNKSMADFVQELSSASPTPGGGGSSAVVAAFATALGMMVTNLTIGKKKYAEYEEKVIEVKEKLSILQIKLFSLAEEDEKAFLPLAQAYRMPAVTEEEKEKKKRVMEEALYEASIVPLAIMESIMETIELLSVLKEKGTKIAISDVGVGITFACAAMEGASLNVFINTKMMTDKDKSMDLNRRAEKLLEQAEACKKNIYCSIVDELR